MSPNKILRVGIIGCGEITQVSHIPIYNFLRDKYVVTYLCDVSNDALAHCASMVQRAAPKTTNSAQELCASPDVDVVLICSSDEYHVPHCLTALQNDKWTLVEKPLAFTFRDYDLLIQAEKKSKGRLFVGTMRRFATAFLEAVKEVGGMERVLFARVRSIIGPNTNFVNQSGTYPRKFSDYSAADSQDSKARKAEMFQHALEKEFGVKHTEAAVRQLFILGSLNSHDISAMREIVGMPKRCLGASLGWPGIYSALFDYGGFSVAFESGINAVPIFDANIEVYSEDKIVKVQFDSPYVKGLPVTMTVREKVDSTRPETNSFGFAERTVRRTFEDPYTLEFLQFYECVVNGKKVKTTAEDARMDLEVMQMIMRAGQDSYKQ